MTEMRDEDVMSDEAEPSAQPPLKIILASRSPRRRELLEKAGVVFDVRTPREKVDESLEPDERAVPAEACKRLAEKKAGAVVQELLAENAPGMYAVIGADTMVVLGTEIFGKPRSLDDAKRMLRLLSGKTHQVITATCLWLISSDGADNVSVAYRTICDASQVTFRDMTEDEIAEYLACGESFDKAGAYAVQGEGGKFVLRVDGDMDTVIGLPVAHLLEVFPDLLR